VRQDELFVAHTQRARRCARRARSAPRPRRRRMITESQLERPPAPEFAVARFELDGTEAAAYKQAYDSFMTATQGQRDSARALRLAVRNAMQAGDRDAARCNFPELQRLGDVLVKAEQQ